MRPSIFNQLVKGLTKVQDQDSVQFQSIFQQEQYEWVLDFYASEETDWKIQYEECGCIVEGSYQNIALDQDQEDVLVKLIEIATKN